MSERLIIIDGSQGEGGGQILRTSLGLAAALGRAVEVTGIRAGRQRPGLRPQHLAAVRAAQAVCNAEVTGTEMGSMAITFRPGPVRAGKFRFDVGTAGSGTLVLQTIIPALMLCEGESDVTVTGGTHNPLAPCFEYLRDVFGPLASSVNCQAYFEMLRAGFYPSGGGEIRMQLRGVGSAENLAPVRLTRRGELRHIDGLSAASYSLPPHIIERQTSQTLGRLAAAEHRATIEQIAWETVSPGTVVFLRAVFAQSLAGCFALGARSKRAEQVADEAVDRLLGLLDSPGVVDANAADQLIGLAALAPEESHFLAERLSDHLRTNAEVIRQLTGRRIRIEPGEAESALVVVEAA